MEFDYKRLSNKKIGKFELSEEMEKDIFRPFMSVGKRKKMHKTSSCTKTSFSILYRAQNLLSFLFYLQT